MAGQHFILRRNDFYYIWSTYIKPSDWCLFGDYFSVCLDRDSKSLFALYTKRKISPFDVRQHAQDLFAYKTNLSRGLIGFTLEFHEKQSVILCCPGYYALNVDKPSPANGDNTCYSPINKKNKNKLLYLSGGCVREMEPLPSIMHPYSGCQNGGQRYYLLLVTNDLHQLLFTFSFPSCSHWVSWSEAADQRLGDAWLG